MKRDPLAPRMRAKADEIADAKPDIATLLRDRADKLEAAATGYFGQPQTHTVQQFLGCYARARLLWCDVTGEPLI